MNRKKFYVLKTVKRLEKNSFLDDGTRNYFALEPNLYLSRGGCFLRKNKNHIMLFDSKKEALSYAVKWKIKKYTKAITVKYVVK